ncbi:MAG: class I SAM-dependent methyltransferase family protein [Candidatus Diapherotrites archaeon]|nr:class I SAM-dependent methyltransferase family protein [Candidatus Diapherotrites archaeon]
MVRSSEKPKPKTGTKKTATLKERLRSQLSDSQLDVLVSGFDSVGNVVIIEVPDELKKKEKLIGETVLAMNPHFQTVAKKIGAHKGKYRVEPLKVIAGKKNLVADYRESGCRFRVSLGKVFFSPRLGTERLRIARLIQPDETVGAFFAGVGPFPIVFAKNSPMKQAIAIELNPVAVKDMKYNIALNKVSGRVQPVQGDVNKIVPKKFAGAFDRIVMPLPKGSVDFLDAAFAGANPRGCVIHFYAFVPAADPFSQVAELIAQKAAVHGFSCRVLLARQVRTFSKEIVQAVLDVEVKKSKARRTAH